MRSSGALWAGLLGELDGVQRGADVVVLGLQEASEPAALVGEAHGEHEGKGFHQPGVGLWGSGVKGQHCNKASDPFKKIIELFYIRENI